MSKLTFGMGLAAGAAAAALLDPDRGGSRRAQLRDRSAALVRRARRVSERGLRSAGSDLYGAAQQAQHMQPEDAHPSDDRLLDRVRSELFRDPTLPKGQINVSVEEGTVVLRGHVADDATKQAVEQRARSIAGVENIDNRINAGV